MTKDVLPVDLVDELRDDLDRSLGVNHQPDAQAELQLRMFETSRANLSLFDREPIVTFAERLIGDDRPAFGADHVHVIHNNSFPDPARPGNIQLASGRAAVLRLCQPAPQAPARISPGRPVRIVA
ncbi:MAG TPA: hypothetical protein VHX59_20175 [Mycobacteriales bacterium]|nr:hypothetical protein [Mycobacteriales bacterium]